MHQRPSTLAALFFFAGVGALSAPLGQWAVLLLNDGTLVNPFGIIIDWVPGVTDRYLWFWISNAIIWLLTGLALLNSRLSKSWAGGLIVAFLATAVLPEVMDGGDGMARMLQYPFIVVALAKAGVLIFMVKAFGAAAPLDASAIPSTPARVPPLTRGPDQVTRLLCGHAVLGGELFRAQFLRTFENNWKALAPEFGVDMGLVAAVAVTERRRYLQSATVLAGLGVIFWFGVSAFTPLAVLAALGAMVVVIRHAWRTRLLAKQFRSDTFVTEKILTGFAATFKRHTRLPAPIDELVVYSGFNPFVGAGTELGGWSVAVLTDKPKMEGAPSSIKAFTVPELYSSIRDAAGALSLKELACRRLFFVAGTDVREDIDILGRDLAAYPRQAVSDARAGAILLGADPLARHYLLLQTTDWGGDLVFSYFIRIEQRGRTLLVETKKFLLPPLATAYRSVDLMQPDRWASRIGVALGAIVTGPILAAFAPLFLFGKAIEQVNQFSETGHTAARKRRKAIELDPAYDFGATSSIRERFAQSYFHHYFQKSDADLFSKLIEKGVLEELIAFLDDHGVDTSDLRERSTTILNSGILVQGGDVRAESLAVGPNAQATSTKTRQPQGASQ